MTFVKCDLFLSVSRESKDESLRAVLCTVDICGRDEARLVFIAYGSRLHSILNAS